MTAVAASLRAEWAGRRAYWFVAASAALAGVVLRVWIYRSEAGIPTSDEAVVGLMVRHLLHGEFTTFFWGQAYGGSQEALITSPAFWVFGPSWLVLRLVSMLLSVLAAIIVWRVGRRTIGEPAALGAAVLLWIWPPYMVWAVTHEFGFFASDLIYCGLLLLLALRIDERPDLSRVALFGLVLGLAFWQTSQIVPVVAGVVVWTVWRQPSCLRYLWAALPLALLGALPWLAWNTRHGWGSLHIPAGNSSTYEHRLRGFVSPTVPMMIGLRVPTTEARILPGALTLALSGLLVVLLAYGAFRMRRSRSSILYVVAAAFPFVWAISPRTGLDTDPRYLVVLTPVIVLLMGQLMSIPLRAAVVLAAGLTLTVAVVERMEVPSPPQTPRDLAPLIATLDRLGLNRVYASYWIAYVLDFDSGETIVAVENRFDSVAFRATGPSCRTTPLSGSPPIRPRSRPAGTGSSSFATACAQSRSSRSSLATATRAIPSGHSWSTPPRAPHPPRTCPGAPSSMSVGPSPHSSVVRSRSVGRRNATQCRAPQRDVLGPRSPAASGSRAGTKRVHNSAKWV